jgi:hypothetical protein
MESTTGMRGARWGPAGSGSIWGRVIECSELGTCLIQRLETCCKEVHDQLLLDNKKVLATVFSLRCSTFPCDCDVFPGGQSVSYFNSNKMTRLPRRFNYDVLQRTFLRNMLNILTSLGHGIRQISAEGRGLWGPEFRSLER